MKKNYFRTKSGAGATVSASMDYSIELNIVLEGSLNPVKIGGVKVRGLSFWPGNLTLSSYYEGSVIVDSEKVFTFKTFEVSPKFIQQIEEELTEQLSDPESDLNYIIKELATEIVMEVYGYKEREELGIAVLEEKIKEQAEEIKKSQKTKIRVEVGADKKAIVREQFGGYHYRPHFKVGEPVLGDSLEYDDFNIYVSISYNSQSSLPLTRGSTEMRSLSPDAFTAYAGPGFIEVWDAVFLHEGLELTDDDVADAIEALDYLDEYDVTKKEELERFKEEHEEELSKWWIEIQMAFIESVINKYK